MGVLGLWQLLSPVGQPVTLESLENKIFAVDISIWLNQAVKGYRDSTGGSVPNAHLLSLFSRLCKLLFYKIKPIIVFDGGFPELKKQTIINRQQRRAAVKQASKDIGLKIISNYLASQQFDHTVEATNLKKVTFKSKEKAHDEIFKLPPLPESSQNFLSDSVESNEDFESKFTNFSREDIKYLNKIDIESDDFNNLPLDVKQEILSTLKEVKKRRTWEQYQELPKESHEFSHYQMQCLLKKRKLQSKLEEVQKDIRKINSSAYVSHYTNDHVIGETNKIMSDDTSYYVLLKKIIEYDESESNKNSSEEVKPSTSVMADAKSAFIRDIENIDFDEDYFSCNSNEDKADVTVKSEIVSSDEELNYSKHCEDKVSQKHTKIKIEKNSLNLSDEEFDVDNPPSSEKGSTKQTEFVNIDNYQEKDTDCTDFKVDEINYNPCAIDKQETQIIPKMDTDLSNQLSAKQVIEIENQASTSKSNYNNFGVMHHNKNTENDNLNIKHNLKNSLDIEEKGLESLISKKHVSKSQNASIDGNNQIRNLLSSISGTVKSSESNVNSEPSDVSMAVNKYSHGVNFELQNELESATAILQAEQAKQDRQASTVQDHMIEECKELLQLFGIPFVVSPLEAEAQCAFYDIVDFTHGTITDDSDVWLFGGKRVYKNFFTQQKFVESYKDKAVFNHFGLSRKKLINFALLTGSDYTDGIEGVGPVTAMEITSEFPGEGIDALQKFKEWWLESNKSTKPPENKVRAKLRKLILPQNFPDKNVVEAYLNPEVDDSMEKFSWGRPDLDALRDYTKERFGWSQSKVDDALLPVLKKLNERDKQTHLDSFFTVTLRKEKNLFPSKRIMSALKKITSPQKVVSEENNSHKRKSSSSKTVSKKFQKATTSRGRGRKSQSQGPVLSEESSSDSDSSQKLRTMQNGENNVCKPKSVNSVKKMATKKVVSARGRGRNLQPQGPVLSEESSSDSNT